MVLAILRFKQTSFLRTKEGKYVFEIGWLVDTNNCPDPKKPRDIPCVTKIRTANHRYDSKALKKILRVKDLAYIDLDRGRRADFKFCLFNMLLVDNSSEDTAISFLKHQVRDFQVKKPNGLLVDLLGEKLTPTKASRKRKKATEDRKIKGTK